MIAKREMIAGIEARRRELDDALGQHAISEAIPAFEQAFQGNPDAVRICRIGKETRALERLLYSSMNEDPELESE